ncbi:flagellar protein FlaG [Candidatus Binatia bacterium]|nr:flagellar protein FlaG [Candidatus Binatia bacterium]
MTIDPHRTTAPIADLATARAERWTSATPRATRLVAPARRVEIKPQAENLAAGDGEKLPAEDAVQQATEPSIRQLAIRKDPEIDRVVVQVIDAQSGEVVRQIPSEEWVRHLKRLKGAKGLFVDQKG